MASIKLSGLESFLRKPDPAVAALLIYGPDQGAVHDVAGRVVLKFSGSTDDPFAVVKLDGSAIASDPGLLADEVQSLSFLGGRRTVWVRGAEPQILKAVELLLKGQVRGNLVVLEAGNLARGSAIRNTFEDSPHALVLAIYESGDGEATGLVEVELRKIGLRVDADAASRLVELVGRSTPILLREAEKLASYCHGSEVVSLADVEAVCGDSSGAESDDLVDAVFAGNLAEVDRFFFHLSKSGVDAGRIMSLTQMHILRLIELRQSVDRGMRVEQAVKASRPPIFFKRQAHVQAQLELWTTEALLSASSSIGLAVLQTRLFPALAESVANRNLLAISRTARAVRSRAN